MVLLPVEVAEEDFPEVVAEVEQEAVSPPEAVVEVVSLLEAASLPEAVQEAVQEVVSPEVAEDDYQKQFFSTVTLTVLLSPVLASCQRYLLL